MRYAMIAWLAAAVLTSVVQAEEPAKQAPQVVQSQISACVTTPPSRSRSWPKPQR